MAKTVKRTREHSDSLAAQEALANLAKERLPRLLRGLQILAVLAAVAAGVVLVLSLTGRIDREHTQVAGLLAAVSSTAVLYIVVLQRFVAAMDERVLLARLVSRGTRHATLGSTEQQLTRSMQDSIRVLLNDYRKMSSAAGRASTLAMLLTGVGVLAPAGSYWLYSRFEPLPTGTVDALLRLKQAGVPLSSVTVPSHDWRLLASGISLGLLFLAASRGLFVRAAHLRSDSRDLLLRAVAIRQIIAVVDIPASGPLRSEIVELLTQLLVLLPQPVPPGLEDVSPLARLRSKLAATGGATAHLAGTQQQDTAAPGQAK